MKNFELFEKYIRGELTKNEKNNFHHKLLEDKEFANKFKIFSEINLFVQTLDKRDLLKKNIKKVTEEYFKNYYNSKLFKIINFNKYKLN